MSGNNQIAYLGIGTNIGNRKRNLEKAVESLKDTEAIEVLKISSVYETEPVGVKEQPWFYNCVAEIKASLSPEQLLDTAKSIEKKMQRRQTIKWGPRIIDIDILLFGDIKRTSKPPVVPHPEMFTRAFVMAPLAEIAPNMEIRGHGRVHEIFANLKNHEKIIKIDVKITV